MVCVGMTALTGPKMSRILMMENGKNGCWFDLFSHQSAPTTIWLKVGGFQLIMQVI